jgi:hypothetical protein
MKLPVAETSRARSIEMSQQTANNEANSPANDQEASRKPPQLSESIWHLPRQYVKVLCRPSAQTFREEMGQAGWGIVLFQFYLLLGITVALSYLAHLIPSSALHTTSAFSIGAFKPFTFLPSPYNGMAFILGSFLIGLSTAYLMSRHWGGQGRFLAHTYSLLLCTIPLVTISGALLLIPATGSLVILLTSLVAALFVYRMVLHGCIIRGVHGLSALKATLVVLIFPLLFVGLRVGLGVLAFILLLIILTEGAIFEVLGAFDWFPVGGMFLHLRKGEERKETPPRTKWR